MKVLDTLRGRGLKGAHRISAVLWCFDLLHTFPEAARGLTPGDIIPMGIRWVTNPILNPNASSPLPAGFRLAA